MKEKKKGQDLKKIERTLSIIREHILKIKGTQQVILYGSYAKGEAKEDSDVDILVVVDDDLDPGKVEKELDDFLFDILLKENKLISLIVVKKMMFDTYRSPLLLNIKEEGIII